MKKRGAKHIIEVEDRYENCGDDLTRSGTQRRSEQEQLNEDHRHIDIHSDDDNDTDNWPQGRTLGEMETAYPALAKVLRPYYCELFGGEDGLAIVRVRYLRPDKNFDMSCGPLDLNNPEHEANLWRYLEEAQPKVVVMGPPRRAFGP